MSRNRNASQAPVTYILVDDVEEGKYVLVHSGYAIEVMSDEAARESLEAWDELLKALEEEDNLEL
jgi:hydrogenase expression/formation protein HypC